MNNAATLKHSQDVCFQKETVSLEGLANSTSSPDLCPREEKKITRVVRNLARDLANKSPETPQPSAWLIRCLIKSNSCGPLGVNWRAAVNWTLTRIAYNSDPDHGRQSQFVELDGTTPLFPNSEGFTIRDTHAFANSLLSYLDYQPPCSV